MAICRAGDQDAGPGGAAQVLHGQPEVLRRRRHDGRAGDLRASLGRDQVLEDHLGQRQVDRLPVERRERRDPDQRTLELADVARDLRGDELQHVRRGGQPVLGRLLAQDGDAGLEVGRLHVGLQAPLEAGAQPVLQGGQLLGRPVELMTICLLALCSVLKVWKNSSWVPSLCSRNWMSSTSRMSTSR
jgi:hypothetical protein